MLHQAAHDEARRAAHGDLLAVHVPEEGLQVVWNSHVSWTFRVLFHVHESVSKHSAGQAFAKGEKLALTLTELTQASSPVFSSPSPRPVPPNLLVLEASAQEVAEQLWQTDGIGVQPQRDFVFDFEHELQFLQAPIRTNPVGSIAIKEP
jgi:hypothetical protein